VTVIAWDGKTLAVDRMASTENGNIFEVTKLRTLNDGTATVGAGPVCKVLEVQNWIADGCLAEDYPMCGESDGDYSVIHVTHDGVFLYQSQYPMKIESKFFAIGSGESQANGALAMGATAKQACEITFRYQLGCGLGVDTFELGPRPKTVKSKINDIKKKKKKKAKGLVL